MVTSRTEIQKQLETAAGNSSTPLLIHSDLLRVGFIDKVSTKEAFLQAHFEIFEGVAKKRTLIFPCFNYDFCRTGLYDVLESPSQVGALADYLRVRGFTRTMTPVFNFCIWGNLTNSLIPPVENVFGPTSLFSWLANNDGEVLFWGARITANTSIHFIEEGLPISYRYPKFFSGQVKFNGKSTPWTIKYRVRPKGLELEYDWKKLESELSQNGLLESFTAGAAKALRYRPFKVNHFMIEKLKQNELHYLDRPSQERIFKLKANITYPFRIEDFEHD